MRPRNWIGALAIVLSLPGYTLAKSYSVESILSNIFPYIIQITEV